MLENLYTTKMSSSKKQLQKRFTKIRTKSTAFAKLMSLAMTLALVFALTAATVVMASLNTGDTENSQLAGGKLTLEQFLGASRDTAVSVTLNNKTVDKDTFFDIAEEMTITSSLNPVASELNGIYIYVETTENKPEYAYISKLGGVDKYSYFHSRLPFAMYTVDDKSQLDKLYMLAEETPPEIMQAVTSPWAEEKVKKFEEKYSLTPADFGTVQYTENISRLVFCNMADVILRENGYKMDTDAANPFEDVRSSSVVRLYRLGIIKGRTETTFEPYDDITREEAATILYRMARFMKKEPAPSSARYDDETQISEWARDSVNAVRGMGIMHGTDGNVFSPNGMYTIEQSIVTMMRLFE